jgi:signal transduction protein with GAF and PtsI domain
MRTAIEHAGAERGLLILPREDDYRIEAEVTMGSDDLQVDLRQAAVGAEDLPESVFRYALRTREAVVLHDASAQGEFSNDEYIRAHRARSVLCLPILKQTRLLGMLYLENNLTPSAFTPARMAILKLLASEAAISPSARAGSAAWWKPTSSASSSATSRGGSSRRMTPSCAWWDTAAKTWCRSAFAGPTSHRRNGWNATSSNWCRS